MRDAIHLQSVTVRSALREVVYDTAIAAVNVDVDTPAGAFLHAAVDVLVAAEAAQEDGALLWDLVQPVCTATALLRDAATAGAAAPAALLGASLLLDDLTATLRSLRGA